MLEIDETKLEPGGRVGAHFRLEQVLGEGGMGVVWDAVDERTGERRALKFLRADKESDGSHEARLLREAHASATVAHPNVARVFEVLELPEGTPFLVMERLEGETLRARLTRVGTLEPAEVVRIVVSIAEALRAAHARGIVHRDLKPDNVFVLRDGAVKVIDFGIAKDLRAKDETGLTATGAMLGTLHYMAPEQVFGDVDVDERADVWALGVVAYECVAGKRPTDAAGSGQVLKAIMTRTFPPLVEVAPACPAHVSELVGRMLSRERDARPSLDEVLDVLAGRAPTAAREVSTVSGELVAPRRPRSRVSLAVLASVAFVGLGGGLAWLRAAESPNAGASAEPPPSASAVTVPGPLVSTVAAAPSGAEPTASSVVALQGSSLVAAPSTRPSSAIKARPSVSASVGTSATSKPATSSTVEAAPTKPPPPPSASALPLATSRKT